MFYVPSEKTCTIEAFGDDRNNFKNNNNRLKVQTEKKWQHIFWQSYLGKQQRNTSFDLWSHFPN